jgi:pimeloyl-ACP methyl ester carboxylesterase
MSIISRLGAGVAAACAALALSAGTAGAADPSYAPVDHPGPPLDVAQAALDQSLHCTSNVAGSDREPILLIPGTTIDPREDFAWNWEIALGGQGWPYCTLTPPHKGMSDIQIAGEHVVNAIRTVRKLAGRPIAIVGHSQGGMVGRWALRWWPDTRPMVADLIGMAPSNHGTPLANLLCTPDCAPAIWQQRAGAPFIKALNSRQETFAPVAYTSIYSHTDEVVVPNSDDTGSSSLHGGDGAITNVAIQDVCPLDFNEHLGIGTYDATAYALTMDALTHDGPAVPARVDRAVCGHPLMPGVSGRTFLTDYVSAGAALGNTLLTAPHSKAEPPLACYVTASCPEPAAASATKATSKKAKAKKKAKARKKSTSKRRTKHRRKHR